jgi:hypothetical protein
MMTGYTAHRTDPKKFPAWLKVRLITWLDDKGEALRALAAEFPWGTRLTIPTGTVPDVYGAVTVTKDFWLIGYNEDGRTLLAAPVNLIEMDPAEVEKWERARAYGEAAAQVVAFDADLFRKPEGVAT